MWNINVTIILIWVFLWSYKKNNKRLLPSSQLVRYYSNVHPGPQGPFLVPVSRWRKSQSLVPGVLWIRCLSEVKSGSLHEHLSHGELKLSPLVTLLRSHIAEITITSLLFVELVQSGKSVFWIVKIHCRCSKAIIRLLWNCSLVDIYILSGMGNIEEQNWEWGISNREVWVEILILKLPACVALGHTFSSWSSSKKWK